MEYIAEKDLTVKTPVSIKQIYDTPRLCSREAGLNTPKSCLEERLLGGLGSSRQYFSALSLQKAFLHLQQLRLIPCLSSNGPWEEWTCVLIGK